MNIAFCDLSIHPTDRSLSCLRALELKLVDLIAGWTKYQHIFYHCRFVLYSIVEEGSFSYWTTYRSTIVYTLFLHRLFNPTFLTNPRIGLGIEGLICLGCRLAYSRLNFAGLIIRTSRTLTSGFRDGSLCLIYLDQEFVLTILLGVNKFLHRNRILL